MTTDPHRSPVDPDLLPSVRQLRAASIGAVILILVLAITVVLPAEEGIDPTGVGAALGLTQIGELKSGAAESPTTPDVASEPAEPVYEFRTDEITLTLAPKKGTEVKAVMRSGDQLVYDWRAEGGALFFDFHGEEKDAPADEFTSFETGQKDAAKGGVEAPFEGVHGWYWENRTAGPVTVVLKTSGVYASIAQKH